MSFFDEASWVLIPEGIKEDVVYAQKPTNGLGDLTFTRASDATRTNSAGVIERTPWNLYVNSEDFSTGWTPVSVTITPNVVSAPNGTLTADAYNVGIDAGNVRHRILQSFSSSIVGQSYTGSYYLKKADHRWVQIVAVVGFSNDVWANFDLESGVVGNGGAGVVATIESVGDGWYRCSVTGVASATNGTLFELLAINNINSGRYPSYQSTEAAVVCYVWGAQAVEGTDAKPYFPTTNRQDVPRLDYRNADGTVSTCPRLLLEPQRTNSIRNSTMVGAVAGSPGTLPTNWTVGGMTQTIAGLGTENGLQYIDVRFSGTSSSTVAFFGFDQISQIAAANGQTWSNSFYAKIIAQPSPPLSYALAIREGNTGGGFVAATQQLFTPTTSLVRYTQTRTIPNATTVFVQPQFVANLTVGATYDFTIRIAAPQMERGAYATTFIPTTTAAVSRLGESFVRNNIFTNGLISAAGGTWFIDLSANTPYTRDTSGGGIALNTILDATTTDNGLNIRNTGVVPSRLGIYKVISSANTLLYTTLTDSVKIAIKWNGTTADVFVNGVKQVSATSFTTTAMQFINSSTIDVPRFINQSALFPIPMTDDQCIEMTTL